MTRDEPESDRELWRAKNEAPGGRGDGVYHNAGFWKKGTHG